PDGDVAEVLARLLALDATAAALAREADDEALRARQLVELDDRTAQLAAQAEVEREMLTSQLAARAAGAARVPELELVLDAARARVTVLDTAEHDLAR